METRNELRRQAAHHASQAADAEEQADDQPKPKPTAAQRSGQQIEQLFREAQHAYLRGDWVDAERRLTRLLRIDRHDVEARLLLATLWRVTDRTGKARRTVDRLSRRQDAQAWRFEVDREWALLNQPAETKPTESEQPVTDTQAEAVIVSYPTGDAPRDRSQAA